MQGSPRHRRQLHFTMQQLGASQDSKLHYREWCANDYSCLLTNESARAAENASFVLFHVNSVNAEPPYTLRIHHTGALSNDAIVGGVTYATPLGL